MATSLLLFLSVLAHELSHSLVAIRRNIPVIGITLMIFGGVSQIAREASRPSTEFIVAVVGPLSSIILAFVFLGLFFGVEGFSDHLSAIFLVLFSANLGLGIFNMLPGFPLDGGRVLRAVGVAYYSQLLARHEASYPGRAGGGGDDDRGWSCLGCPGPVQRDGWAVAGDSRGYSSRPWHPRANGNQGCGRNLAAIV